VFAGGELVRASGPVVWEVRDGRRAAQGIHRYLFARRVSELAASETDHLAPG
jgi:glutamate synthase (NADPH/NADH) small chain